MTDFSTPRRMSAGAFVILLQKSFREIVGTTFIAIAYLLFDIFNSDTFNILELLAVAAVLFTLPFLTAFLKYYFCKFHIEGDKLIFTYGLASKKTTSIPLSRVHTMRTKSGLFYRLLDLHGVTFDTLATYSQEVELILDDSDMQMLLHRVRMGEEFTQITDVNIPLPPPLHSSKLKVSDLNIMKGALCQNHLKGFAILATILVAVYDKINQLGNDVTSRLFDYLDSRVESVLPSASDIILFSAVIYLTVMLLWTGKILLRYSNMSLQFADNKMTIESGLLSRYTCRIAQDKATVLTIKQNPLEKAAHCQTITISQALNVMDTKKEGNIRIYGSDLGDRLFEWWLGCDKTTVYAPLMWAQSGKGVFMRKFFPFLIIAIVMSFTLFYTLGSVIPALIICSGFVAVTAMRAAMAWKHSGIKLYDTYVQINGGNIARLHEHIKYPDIESVSIRTTPLTPITARVTLQISTNAKNFRISSLETKTASSLRHLLLQTTYTQSWL